MKVINTYISESIKDSQTVIPALKNAAVKLAQNYQENTHPKLRILDNLVILCILSFFA